jgi:predicted amidophosphoribosyltransferase
MNVTVRGTRQMPIKAIILDISDTLLERREVVSGVPEMIGRLRGLGLSLFFVSNNQVSRLTAIHPCFEEGEYLDSFEVGGKKGSGRFVDAICNRHELERNELLYLGDSDNDMKEAVNRSVAFFSPKWAVKDYPYGLKMSTPDRFATTIETFFLKEALWYYQVNDVDALNRPVIIRALLDPDECKNAGITRLLKQKQNQQFDNAYMLSDYLSLHLFASLYLEGLHLRSRPRKPIIWGIYPSHKGSQTGVLERIATLTSRMFREAYVPGLIYRHTPAVQSHKARQRGERTTLSNQLQTIHLDPDLRNKVRGRCIIIIDDFTTGSNSFEAARNILYNAGAAEVVCIAVGKYPVPYNSRSPVSRVSWDSFSPTTHLKDADFGFKSVREHRNEAALGLFVLEGSIS